MQLVKAYANIVGHDLVNNSWFDKVHRDDCTHPFLALRNFFKQYNIELNSIDLNSDIKTLFTISIDLNLEIKNGPIEYLMLLESEAIRPKNLLALSEINNYKYIFTWDDDLVIKDNKFIKFYLPVKDMRKSFPEFGWANRSKLLCMIAGNKANHHGYKNELYSERLNAIKWFEKNHIDKFSLYGFGWANPSMRRSKLGRAYGRLENFFFHALNVKPFKSYLGAISSKFVVLSKYRFCVCFENVSDKKGYITEKIFDAFFAGCVPIYLGAPNILSYVPKNCFVDMRDFISYQEMYEFISTMTESKYIEMQKNIKQFLDGEVANKFYSENFANFVGSKICQDIGINEK